MEVFGSDFAICTNAEFKRLLEWVDSNGFEALSNREAARYIGYSEQYFCRWFRVLTGMTFQDYLRRRKIELACRLLKEGMNVAEVSVAVGYSKPASFIKSFKKYMKETPYVYTCKYSSKEGEDEP